jgi:hypothetical protein
MKSKYFNFFNIWIIALFFTVLSCTEVLDVAPDGNLTMEDVLVDPNKTGALLAACYDQIPDKSWNWWYCDNLLVSCSDDAWTAWDFQGATFVSLSYAGRASAAFHPIRDGNVMDPFTFANNDWYWPRYWEQIRRCQLVIDLVDKSTISEANKQLYKAEARVLKAWFYSELVKYFGKLPILTEMVPYDNDFSTSKRESVYDVVTKCIAPDCDAAIAATELPWRIDNPANAQRVTKALAHTIKATMYLYAASPLHNEGNNYWEEAYKVCQTAVNELESNGYELFTTCTEPSVFGTGDAAAFHQLICREMDYPQNRDKETIWQNRETGLRVSITECYMGSGEQGAGGTCGPTPSQELIDAFETRNGEPVLDLKQPYLDEKHLQPNFRPGTGYNDQDPYANRDPRMYVTALLNGTEIVWNNGNVLKIETFEGGRHSINMNTSLLNVTRTGYFHRKMVPPNASQTNGTNLPLHKHYRLAEVILDYAEAAAEAGHPAEAKAAVDEIRARVKMPPLPNGLSQEELILRVRNERRVELSFEQQRYFDIRRWQKPEGNIESLYKWATGMLIRKQSDGSFTYTRINTSTAPRMGYENRDLLLPLPLNEAALLESVTGEKWQNPGW